ERAALLRRQSDRLHVLDGPDSRVMSAGDDEIRQRPALKFGRPQEQGLLRSRNPRFQTLGSFGRRVLYEATRRPLLLCHAANLALMAGAARGHTPLTTAMSLVAAHWAMS